jgi:hypothetical protein
MGGTQTTEEELALIITYMGSVRVKITKQQSHWLIWALMNKDAFGIAYTKKKLTRQSRLCFETI